MRQDFSKIAPIRPELSGKGSRNHSGKVIRFSVSPVGRLVKIIRSCIVESINERAALSGVDLQDGGEYGDSLRASQTFRACVMGLTKSECRNAMDIVRAKLDPSAGVDLVLARGKKGSDTPFCVDIVPEKIMATPVPKGSEIRPAAKKLSLVRNPIASE